MDDSLVCAVSWMLLQRVRILVLSVPEPRVTNPFHVLSRGNFPAGGRQFSPIVFSQFAHITGSERLNTNIPLAFSTVGDGSFVETSSGAAARELKKRYDERLGVGTSAKGSYSISPYAITTFVNQHGKQMYRVG
jgi:hypothetical protein